MQNPDTEVRVEAEPVSSEGSVADERAKLISAEPGRIANLGDCENAEAPGASLAQAAWKELPLPSTLETYPDAEEWLLPRKETRGG